MTEHDGPERSSEYVTVWIDHEPTKLHWGVPVVRCRDCKSFSHGYCKFHDAKFVRPDGYCYWGEQKEGEQHD